MDAEWLAQNHERCKKFLRRQEFGSVREMSYEVNQIASTEDAFAAFEGCGSRELERVGLSGLFLQNGVAWARDVPCVKRYIEETGAKPVDVQRFAALIAHSVSSVSGKVKATPTCASTSIGVGDLVRRIDDVAGHCDLYKASIRAGLGPECAMTHVHYGHLMATPQMLSAAAIEVNGKGVGTSRDEVKQLWAGLERRLGKPKLAVLCHRAHLYVGPKVVRKHLKQHAKVDRMLKDVVQLCRNNGDLSAVFQRLAQDGLDGIKDERGYWTINEGRLLCKSFSGLATPGDLTVDDKALQMCLQMGQGLEEGKSHLKVETPQHLKRCAAFLEQVSRAARHPIQCTPLQTTVCLCEASRRGCFASHGSSSFGRRRGRG